MDMKTENLESGNKMNISDSTEPASIDKPNSDIQVKTKSLNVNCEKCSENFINEVALKIHEMLHREDNYCFVCKRNISKNFHKHVQERHMNHICEICNNVYQYKKTLDAHIRSHTKERIFKCDQCDKAFMQKGALTSHINYTHLGFKPYICEKCGGTFTTLSSLKKHLRRMHSEERMFECSICTLKFNENKKKNDHEKSHTKSTVCEVCKRRCGRRVCLVPHLKAHFKTMICIHCKRKFHKSEIEAHVVAKHQPRECPDCKKIFYDGSTLTKHQVCHQKTVTCELCRRNYKESNMKRHLQLHKKNKIQRCEICNYIFSDIDKHTERMHKNTSRCFCPICPKSFQTRWSKTRHMTVAHSVGEGKYKCTTCGKMFTSSASLAKHTTVHYQLRPYKCFICRRRFKNIYRLEKHKLLHDKKDYKYKCTSCGRAFKIEQSLKSHRCGGTFKCYLCDIKYRDKGYLKRHLIMYHSPVVFTEEEDIKKSDIGRINFLRDGSRKFQCKKCQAVFKYSNSFRMHFCSMHNRLGFSCPVCRNRYKFKKDLVQHLNEKHPGRRVKCEVCGLLFISTRSLRKHQKKYHVSDRGGIKKEECESIKEDEQIKEEIKTESEDTLIDIKEEPLVKSELPYSDLSSDLADSDL